MADESDFPDLLAHEVTADAGMVGAETEDGMVSCVRLTFHHGHEDTNPQLVRHSEKFLTLDALSPLIGQLRALEARLEADQAVVAVEAGYDGGPGTFKDFVRELSTIEPALLDLPLTSFTLGSLASVLDEVAAGNPPMLEILADTLEDLLHGPMGDEVRRVAEAVGQIIPGGRDHLAVHPDCTCPHRTSEHPYVHDAGCPVA